MDQHGTFHWNELRTGDVEGAKAFYAELLGWTYESFSSGDFVYWLCMCDGKPVGGITGLADMIPQSDEPYWFSNVAVDDVDKCVATAAKSGGEVLVEPFDVPTVGRVAVVRDSTGAGIGLITPA